MNSIEIEELLNLAEMTARKAGSILLEYSAEKREVIEEREKDIKIRADKESEALIIKELSNSADFSILSEEAGFLSSSNTSATQGFRWIIDPLDGSVNYVRGIPLGSVSIAFWSQEEPIFGVVYDFYRDELFKGIVGEGAYLNNNAIKTSNVAEKSKGIICTGFPVSMDYDDNSLQQFIDYVKMFKKVRLLGSAALSLAYVAAGRADVYCENHIKIWDVAAGLALVKTVGGTLQYYRTKSDTIYYVKASNGFII